MYKYNYSVIIPYYKAEKSIYRLINSIPEREDIQIIIVNDKCTTFNSEIANSREHIVLLENNTHNKGAGCCRNIGVDRSEGKFLLFADADDYFLENAFKIFDSYIDCKADVVYFSPISMFEGSLKSSTRHLYYKMLVENFVRSNSDLLRYYYFVPWSKMISRDLVVQYNIRFDEIIASNDINFSLQVGLKARSVMADLASVYCVVDSLNSLTKQKSTTILDARFVAMCRFNNILKSAGLNRLQLPLLHYLKAYSGFGLIKLTEKILEGLSQKQPILFTVKSFLNNRNFRQYKATHTTK
ncbi:glycosyltransferase family 2 protein [Thalassotalea maritima]|uniref:glycosyltransferase family 2 protein n=1 Tax=Thalassotalea maritima TaxID=3242416 RepID=UPI003527E5E2